MPPLPPEEIDAIIHLLKMGVDPNVFRASDGSRLSESVFLAKLRMAGAVFHYAALKQPDDPRDFPLPVLASQIPNEIYFRSNWPRIEQQGSFNSCCANGGTSALEYYEVLNGTFENKSRMAVYYWARMYDGLLAKDEGTTIRSTMKALNKIGAPPERIWPYIERNLWTRPTPDVEQIASQHQITSYHAVPQDDLNAILHCIGSGYPVVLAINIFPAFESVDTLRMGMVPMPIKGERSLGAHAVCLLGYSMDKKLLLGANSWGSEWGDSGFFWLPFDYILKGYSFDAWAVVKAV